MRDIKLSDIYIYVLFIGAYSGVALMLRVQRIAAMARDSIQSEASACL